MDPNATPATPQRPNAPVGASVYMPATSPRQLQISTNPIEPTKLNGEQLQRYVNIARQRSANFLDRWEIRELSEKEIEECRSATRAQVQLIHALEQQKNIYAPLVNPQVEIRLFIARVDYRATFPRVFRLMDLPTEIICEIFAFVAWDTHDSTLDFKNRRTLTQVCRQWRKIAHEDGSLWSLLWFKYTTKNAQQGFDETASWFKRAAKVPKDIRISDDGENPMPVSHMAQIVDLLRSAWTSIRLLVIVANQWEPCFQVLTAMQDVAKLPKSEQEKMQIKRFEIHRTGLPYVEIDTGHDNNLRYPLPLFGGVYVPTLSSLSLDGMQAEWNQTRLSNLTVLDLRRMPQKKCPSFAEFRALLQSSPMLYKMILDGAGPRDEDEHIRGESLGPVTLLHLKIFALSDFSPSYGTYVMSLIDAPHLRDLTLMRLVHADYSPFFKTLSSHFKGLRILTLYHSELQFSHWTTPPALAANQLRVDAVVDWLITMPDLTYLRVGSLGYRFFNVFLLEHPQQPGTLIAPNLSILEWQGMDQQLILDWMHQRMNNQFPIKKVYSRQEKFCTDIADQRLFIAAMRPGEGSVYRLPPNSRAQEEADLQR